MGYMDQTFCSSEVEEHTCGREFTEQDAINAKKWWGGDDYPVAYGKFCEISSDSKTTPQCEHNVSAKHCFRCKRPDLAGPTPQSDAVAGSGLIRNMDGSLDDTALYSLSFVQQATKQAVEAEREKKSKRYVTLMNQALGDTELPEEVWGKIAKVNQLILDK